MTAYKMQKTTQMVIPTYRLSNSLSHWISRNETKDPSAIIERNLNIMAVSSLFFSFANSAFSIAFFRNPSVYSRVFVTSTAMGTISKALAVGNSSKQKTIFINQPFWISDFLKSRKVRSSFYERFGLKTTGVSQVSSDVFFPLNYKSSGHALVSLLFFLSRPTTVFWKVTQIIVNSIKAREWRSFPHVSAKRIKTCPLWAYLYASLSIMFIGNIIRVGASLLHPNPNRIEWVANPFGALHLASLSHRTDQCKREAELAL